MEKLATRVRYEGFQGGYPGNEGFDLFTLMTPTKNLMGEEIQFSTLSGRSCLELGISWDELMVAKSRGAKVWVA